MADPVSPLSTCVHVWAAPLDADAERLAALLALLSPEEQRRAARFTHVPARQQYIAARGTLRLLLARYLGALPGDLCFTTDDHGKPTLAGRELHFNVSHTSGLALYAFTTLGEVGIDVERVRPHASHLDMARRFFTPGEAEAIHAQASQGSESAFFAVWTRKEAFLKALGLGLSFGLERFEVSVPPDYPPRVLHIDGDAHAGAAWSLVALQPAPGYVGTLALLGEVPRVEMRAFE